MRSLYSLLFLLWSIPTFAQNSATVTGMVSLSDGTTAPSGVVSFYRVDPPPAPNKPQTVQHAPVRPEGNYIVHLNPGTYRVCTQVWDVAGLDPCLWSDAAPTLTVAAATKSANFPVVLTAAKFVRVHINDGTGKLLASPTAKVVQDLRLGVMTASGFVRPATIEAKDATGITYRAIAPIDRPAPLLLHHHNIGLATVQGQALANEEWSDITSNYIPPTTVKHTLSAVKNLGPQPPDVTLSVTEVLAAR